MWYVFETLRSILDLKRTCPKCKRPALARLEDKNKRIKCKSCGAMIPPPGERVAKRPKDDSEA